MELKYKKFPTCSEPSIVLTVILTSKNEVLQIIQTSSCLFYKWTISLLSIFTSFPSIWWEWLLVARFTCYIWYFSDPQNIPLLKVCRWLWHIIEIIWPYHHTTPHHTTLDMAIPRYQFVREIGTCFLLYIFLVFAFKKHSEIFLSELYNYIRMRLNLIKSKVENLLTTLTFRERTF